MLYDWSTWILCLNLVQLVQARGHAPPHGVSTRIVNGQVAQIEDFPYMISLIYDDVQLMCGGSVVSNRWVLTTAHCINQPQAPDKRKLKISAGSNMQGEGQIYDIAKFVTHELNTDPQSDVYADLALLQIKDKFKFGPTLRRIKLNSGIRMKDSMYKECKTVGWGMDQKNGVAIVNSDQMLRSIRMRMIESGECDKEWTFLYRSHICAIGEAIGSATCYADAGAPLACNGTLVGILCYRTNDCEQRKSEVYTRVSSFHSWIIETIRGNKESRVTSGDMKKSRQKEKEKKKRQKMVGAGGKVDRIVKKPQGDKKKDRQKKNKKNDMQKKTKANKLGKPQGDKKKDRQKQKNKRDRQKATKANKVGRVFQKPKEDRTKARKKKKKKKE